MNEYVIQWGYGELVVAHKADIRDALHQVVDELMDIAGVQEDPTIVEITIITQKVGSAVAELTT